MKLLPFIQPQAAPVDAALPLYREVAWNFQENRPLFRGGSPVIVTGVQAVLVWAWKALQVQRYRYPIYSWDYGNEWEDLIGTTYTDDLKQAEAARYVRECLLVNPYITGVRGIAVSFREGIISVQCTLETVYGEVELDV